MNLMGGKGLVASYVSSFLLDFTTAAIMLVIPIYAYMLGSSPFEVGLIGASGGGTYALSALAFGKISDRVRRKNLLLLSSFILAVNAFSYSIAQDFILLVFLVIVQNIALGIFWPNIESFIATHSGSLGVKGALRGYNISWSLGWIIGPPLGGFLLSINNPKYAFYTASILFFLGFAILTTLPNDPPMSKINNGKNKAKKYSLRHLTPAYSIAFIFAFTTRTQGTLFPVYAASIEINPGTIGAIMFFVGFTRTIIFIFTRLIERISNRYLAFIGPALLSISMFLIFFGKASWHFALGCALLGLGSGISYLLSLSTILGKTDEALGLRAGLFESIIGVGSVSGPLLGGIVSTIDPKYPYAMAGLACILTLIYIIHKENP
jgi:MFS family permease